MEKYVEAKNSCMYEYKVKHDFSQAFQEFFAHLVRWQGERLLQRERDPDAILDMALRYITGCGVLKVDAEGALYVLDALTDRSCDPERYVGNLASPSLIAQAHSCAAHAYLDKFTASPAVCFENINNECRFSRPTTLRIGIPEPTIVSFDHAAYHANESAKLRLISPVVLRVGFMLRDIGTQLGIDLSPLGQGRSRKFRPLWRAVSRRTEEIYAEERKMQQQVECRPNEYVCSATGCGIGAERRAALRACSGSKECQIKDWTRHKAICKAGSSGKKVLIDDSTNALVLFELGDVEDGDGDEPAEAEAATGSQHADAEDVSDESARALPPGPGRTVEVPTPDGCSIKITTNTLDPKFMRSF
ncbi:hypothetical protein C8Q79DRAFT_1004094 [Trametes meyenii]|nr:hypothetical protein C8Q79DRAFT_1004094 [Trametes meyenii]